MSIDNRMGDRIRAAQDLLARETRIWPYFDSRGNLSLLFQLVEPLGTPGATIGSCNADDTQALERMVRAWIVGRALGIREVDLPPPPAKDEPTD